MCGAHSAQNGTASDGASPTPEHGGGKVKTLSVLSKVAAALALGLSSQASAQDYPNKPVRVIVPLAPGGATDIQARLFSQKLSQALNQTFLVDNRAGAGGMIAFRHIVQQANTDGYTLLATSPGFTNAPALYEKPPFDPAKDFEPIILMSKAPYALVINPKFPATTMKEFLAWGKGNAGKLNFAISGLGTTIHLAQVWLADAANIKMAVIPYKGTGPATQDLIAGRVHASFANVISAGPHIKAGRIRPLAVTTAERSPALPELPTFAESGLANYEVTTWHGWLGPKGMPRSIVARLNTQLNLVLKDPDVAKAVSEDGGVIIGGTPESFRKHISGEVERWKRLVQLADIKPRTD
jgi:tripartite-type tricarboxylate transporter receptor subunit TctC